MGFKAKLAISSLVLFSLISSTSALTVDDVSRSLICQCGCNMLVSACEGAMACSSADQMKVLIGQKIDQGWSKEQITGYFVAQYGEKVRAAPTKRGFNLTAWILPFVAIIAGAGVIYILVVRWVRRREERVELGVPSESGGVDRKYEDRFRKELESFE